MLYVGSAKTRNELYTKLVEKLKNGKSREAIREEVEELCENCRPSSPVVCMEFCQIWRFKREFGDAPAALAEKPSLTDLFNLTKNHRRLKILEILIEEPHSLKELRDELEEKSCYHSLNLLRDQYVEPLVEGGLIKNENGLYRITSIGKTMYDISTRSEAGLLIHSKGYEEKILKALLSGSKSCDELAKVVLRGSLYRSLKRLQVRGLVVKSSLSGRVFYYRAKRRPTRKFSPSTMKVFNALPKEGISVLDLSEKVGMSARRVYKHLRRLRYKRHVKKGRKTAIYSPTDAGRRLAQSLNMAYSPIQGQSDSKSRRGKNGT